MEFGDLFRVGDIVYLYIGIAEHDIECYMKEVGDYTIHTGRVMVMALQNPRREGCYADGLHGSYLDRAMPWEPPDA